MATSRLQKLQPSAHARHVSTHSTSPSPPSVVSVGKGGRLGMCRASALLRCLAPVARHGAIRGGRGVSKGVFTPCQRSRARAQAIRGRQGKSAEAEAEIVLVTGRDRRARRGERASRGTAAGGGGPKWKLLMSVCLLEASFFFCRLAGSACVHGTEARSGLGRGPPGRRKGKEGESASGG
jgi:hypothetical protein